MAEWTEWTSLQGTPLQGRFTQATCGPNMIWACNDKEVIYARALARTGDAKKAWQKASGKCVEIATGPQGFVYCASKDGRLFHRVGESLFVCVQDMNFRLLYYQCLHHLSVAHGLHW